MKTLITLGLGLLLSLTASAQTPKFHRLDGSSVDLAQLTKASPQGVVMLVTWCSECPSCRRVEGQIQKLMNDYRDRAKVVVVDVHAPDTPTRIRQFLTSTKSGLDVVIDETLVEDYKIEKTATALLFDGQGKLRYYGQFSTKQEECARRALQQLLKGEKVTPEKTAQNGCTFIPRGKKPAPVPSCDLP
jgi:thiol-disulfide isomerase/thioredoxin